jgi:hypothetical protein
MGKPEESTRAKETQQSGQGGSPRIGKAKLRGTLHPVLLTTSNDHRPHSLPVIQLATGPARAHLPAMA